MTHDGILSSPVTADASALSAEARMDVDGPARSRRAPRTGLGSDLVLAGALAVVGVVGTLGADSITGVGRPVDGLALALVLAAAAIVALRRRLPLAALAAITVLTSAYLLLGYPYGSVFFPFFVAVYTIAAHRDLGTAVPAAAVSLAALQTHVLTHEAAIPGLVGIVPGSAWVIVPFAIGVTVRLTREARRREQAEAVRDRVYDERLRIAQEVHHVVGHGLAAIKMQADVALHVLARRPKQAEQALTAISRTSAEALDEVRGHTGRRPTARHRPDTDPGPAPHRRPDQPDDRGRCAGRRGHHRNTAGTAPGGRARGLPRGVGVADQRAAPRAVQDRRGPDRLRSRRRDHRHLQPDRRLRPDGRPRWPGATRRLGHHRHDRTGHRARRGVLRGPDR